MAKPAGTVTERTLPERLLDARILVIDDEQPNVELVTRLLNDAGYRNVEGRTTPPDEISAVWAPDLVLLDLLMPAMDGYEILSRIRAAGLTDLDLPVVVLTADARPDAKLRAFRSGASDFLTKPFDLAEVLLRVRLHLERHFLHRDSSSHGELLERTVAEQTDELLRLVRGLQGRTVSLAAANAKLRESEEQRSWFFTTASHELRTPLTAVVGFATTLRYGWGRISDDERLEFVRSIERQGRRLVQLTEDLLTIAAADRDALAVDVRATEVAPVLELALESFASANAAIEVDLPPDLEVVADPERLTQIMVNLIANALRYGREPIVIEAHREGGEVEISVRDHGEGIPADLRERLFDRFARSPSQETRIQQGFGLGLAIASELVRIQDGSLRYEDATPSGARLVVRLPAVDPSAAATLGGASAARARSRRGESNP